MKKTRVIIIDDELDAIDALTNIIEMESDLYDIVGTENNPVNAIKLIKEQEPDVIFLDVEMPELTGFDLLRSFEEIKFEVIFATAFEHYAIQAIKNNAIDYIVKPVSISEVLEALQKVRKKHNHNEDKTLKYNAFLAEYDSVNTHKLKIPTLNGIKFADLNEIIYFEADGNYTNLEIIGGKSYIVTKNIKTFEEELPEKFFLRTHRSYIVNTQHIKLYSRHDGMLVMANDKKVPLARRRYRDYKEILDSYLG